MLIAPPARWQQIEALFADAIDRPAAGRAALLESACAGDPALRTSLERLLRAHDRAEGFLRELDSARAAALIEVSGMQDGEGQIIGRYRVVRQLGRGGMGVVYLAHDERLDRQVALKLLPPYLSADGEAARRLTEEARAASALDHPHIITIYEIGETADGRLFLAMAYYEGETLRERITRGPLPITEARELATQIAEGLTAAHRKGIVHRDIKPENVLITTEGVAKVVDFGLAKVGAEALTRPGVAPGTVAYMSPEQTRGAPVDPRADLWSLGVVLYEMLAGVRPFRGEAEAALVHGIRHDEPVALRELRPEVGARLARIVERCMLKDAAARYSNAADLLADLRTVAQVSDGEGTATRTHTGPPVLLRSRKRRSAAVVGTIAAIVLAGAGLWAWYGANGGEIAASADSRIAVVPFTPVVAADTALERLGRELVVTLSASLNGTAEIRTIEPITILAQHDGLNSGTALADAAARVRSLGAGRLVHGTLVRSGSDVRVDAGIFDSRTLESLGRAAASAAAGDIAALSDRTALALLRVLAAGADVQAPSLAVLTTSSVEALRAYLEGERAIALGQFNLAPAHFGRAIAADSTFRFAYWRYYYARSHGGQAVDSAVWASVLEHRYEFPEPDRLLIEVRLAEGQREGIARLQNLTARFPNYWPAWFELGRLLTFQGPYLGVPRSVTRNALERAAALNPHFVPTWERLLWMEEADRDTAAAARMLERLEAVRLDTLRQREINLDALGYYRCLHSLARSEGEFTPECATGVSELTSYRGPWAPERIALNAPEAGFARAAIELAERIQASGQASPEVFAAHSWAMALSWAARGDWEAAMSAAERYVRAGTHPRAALWVYGLAATGVWLGTVPAPRAAALRQLALRSPTAGTVNGAAEIAWLDGLVARADGDTTGLRDAVAELRRNSARSAPVLAESLEGLAAELAGDREGAARRLAALEWDNADRGWHLGFGQAHPYVNSVNRLAAGRWLLEAGDTAEAARVLLWHRAVLPGALHPLPAVNTALGNLALFELAQIEEPRGRPELARLYNMLFLERYDRPPPQHREMVERARASRARLAARE
jgi:predicted Ser/Thr protein kinase/TolB-like protein